MEENKTIRQSNFELLRIICMLMLVAHHCCVHGGILQTDSPNKYFALIFLPVGKICFVAFLTLSMYFLCEKQFKAERFIKTWLEVFFYSITFCVLSFIFVPRSTISMIQGGVSALLPISGNSHGFASTYLLFYLLLPFVKKSVDGLEQKPLKFLIVILFYAQILEQIIMKFTRWVMPIYSLPTLFLFFYTFLLYLKRYSIRVLENKFFTGMIVILVWAFVYVTNYMAFKNGNRYLTFLNSFTVDESSLLYVIAGIALFFFFKEINIPQSKLINKIATCTFGVLLIHDHQFFRYALWQKIVKTQEWYYSDKYILYFVLVTLCVFITCSVFDFLRQITIEKLIMKSKLVNKATIKLNSLLGRTV